MSSSVPDCTTETKGKVEDEKTPASEVHSANSWETADLGDKHRNEKFLRLMGAAKKEHHGKIVIGENKSAHARDKTAEAHLQENLEEQFSQGMEHRLAGGRRGHLGLGFHPPTDTSGIVGSGDTQVEEGTQKSTGTDKNEEKEGGEYNAADNPKEDSDSSREKDERKRKSLDKDGEHEVKKMKFVKSSP